MKKIRLIALLWVTAVLGTQVSAQTTCPNWPTAERFAIQGAEVTDRRTGLVWARCSVGQNWAGDTCAGTPIQLTHEQAFQYAAGQSGWRLPNRRELFSLVEHGCSTPSIDRSAFPNTTSSWYWSSSPDVNLPFQASIVDFTYGYVGFAARSELHRVRLVRTSQ